MPQSARSIGIIWLGVIGLAAIVMGVTALSVDDPVAAGLAWAGAIPMAIGAPLPLLICWWINKVTSRIMGPS